MRVQQLNGQDKEKAREFSDFLLRVGEGCEQTYIDDNGEKNNIKVPRDLLIDGDEEAMIKTVYPDLANK